MKRVLVIHGPNLNLLGVREPEIYGTLTLKEINYALQKMAKEKGVALRILQSNHEGEIVDFIHRARNWAQAMIINPGAYTHTSIAIRDAITSSGIPTVEVHLSNIYRRETFRKQSYIAEVADGQISGLGLNSYLLGLQAAIDIIDVKGEESGGSSATLGKTARETERKKDIGTGNN
jgi:3-dehydroquinate dehydratase-2